MQVTKATNGKASKKVPQKVESEDSDDSDDEESEEEEKV